MQVTKGERHLTVLLIYDTYLPQQLSAWHKNHKGIYLEVTNAILLICPVQCHTSQSIFCVMITNES